MMLPEQLLNPARELVRSLRERRHTLVTVESCTGGLLGAAITAIPGSSEVYTGGFITYSNQLKQLAVAVDPRTLSTHGAVSAQTARQMAAGGLERTDATHAVAITGIAGPAGGTDDKPVGTVWICATQRDRDDDCRRFLFPGDRAQVRLLACVSAMAMLAPEKERGTLPHEAERVRA